MHKSNIAAHFNLSLFFQDIIIIILSFFISCSIFCQKDIHMSNYFWVLVIYIPLWILTMYLLRMYNSTTFNYFDRIFRSIIFTSIFTDLLTIVLVNYIKEQMFRKNIFFVFFILNFLLFVLHRYMYVTFIQKHTHTRARRVIVVGIPSLYEKLNIILIKLVLR